MGVGWGWLYNWGMGDGSGDMVAVEGRIGGYRVLRELAEGRTWAAEGNGGKRVVLKIVESDCLMGQQLHPMIRDRLGRVRELAHVGVANLYGVERCGEQVFLVWEWVEGVTLEEWLGKKGEAEGCGFGVQGSGRNEEGARNGAREGLGRVRRELRQGVEAMHALGIVHGAIHGRNVIVRAEGGVCLTHVSPLLYNDPVTDLAAVGVLEGEMGEETEKGRGGEVKKGRMGEWARESVVEGGRDRRMALLGALVAAVEIGRAHV